VLRKPNTFQNHIQFKEWWITSKLIRGNAYALKQRDNRGVVTALYLLDPCMVQVLVSPNGSVFYQLGEDNLAGLKEGGVQVPASEIIHDRMNCLFHPLVGLSPLFAAGLAANQGLSIQKDSSSFFGNGAKPSGILIAPGAISDETATRLKDAWMANYTGENAGKIAVVGDGLSFQPMRMSSVDAQLIEQLRWTAEVVCSCFHVPPYMVGVGPAPTYNNIEALSQQYYTQCLQTLIESMELCLDEGLALPSGYGTELDLEGLLRMDTATQIDALNKAVGGGWMSPNEARAKRDMPPVKGGATPYLQQQNYSLAALDARDKADPFAKPTPVAEPQQAIAPDPDQTDKALHLLFRKSPESLAHV
jgi:HK97 family phage portal protein